MSIRLGILGGSGQVGTELRRCAERQGAIAFAPSSADVDISRAGALESWIKRVRPELIVNCAAYTAVDRAEDERDRAFEINASGVGLLAQCARDAAVPIIHLSTDYVFAGDKTEPYVEDDPTAPINVYGQSKLQGELELSAHHRHATIVRIAWVFSQHGRNFVKAILARANSDGRLKVVNDQFGGPLSARAVADAIWRIMPSALQGKPRTYHLEAQPYVTWYEFAREIVERATAKSLLNRAVDVHPITTAEFPTRARRPVNSRLSGARIRDELRIERSDWRAELDHVLDELASTAERA